MSYAPKSVDQSRRRGTWIGIPLAVLLAGGTFFTGLQFGQSYTDVQSAGIFTLFAAPPEVVDDQERVDLKEFWKVWELMDQKFAVGSSSNALSDQEKVQGAIDGLVRAYGDPYTVYLPPVEASAFDEDIAGEFSGVGMEIGLRDGLVTVIAPLPNTPAERAGIIAGDVLVAIDETTTENMRVDEAVKLIRGERGTTVTLRIYREGETEFLDIPVTRDTIEIPTSKTEVVDGVFIVSLYSFNAVSEQQIRAAMLEYKQGNYERMILDLRGNPGGFLQSAVAIASHFVPAGKVIVSEQFGGDTPGDVFRSRGRQAGAFSPETLVVLVDGGSASASEIVAGALKDHGVATVIGAQTFGKGSVQELVRLDSKASLKVTVARWLTPNGTSISEGGLAPDITITRSAANRLANEDPQRAAALQFLAGELVESETNLPLIAD